MHYSLRIFLMKKIMKNHNVKESDRKFICQWGVSGAPLNLSFQRNQSNSFYGILLTN